MLMGMEMEMDREIVGEVELGRAASGDGGE